MALTGLSLLQKAIFVGLVIAVAISMGPILVLYLFGRGKTTFGSQVGTLVYNLKLERGVQTDQTNR